MDKALQGWKPGTDEGRLIGPLDVYLFRQGTHFEAYNMLGARPVFNSTGQIDGYYFAVWAPNAVRVSVVGDWNDWQPGADAMEPVGDSGIWEKYIADIGVGWTYKFALEHRDGSVHYKADPFARFAQLRPETASRTWYDDYKWHDGVYRIKHGKAPYNEPMSIYELHLGSWVRSEKGEMLSYRDIADKLAAYAQDNGYTHVELLPLAEHPYDGSWGYQVTGFYAPTSRYGTPEDFKYFVDTLHAKGIGVIMDWVPAHFSRDEHGLARFDGTALYEAEGDRGDQKQWGTLKFNLERPEVRSFLISNALYWLSEYHLDGLRVDAVSCMLYLDYGARDGEWTPNEHGGRENLAAVEFIKRLNTEVYARFPNAIMVAEESTDYPRVTVPVSDGGLGFGFKWNMGWMNDTLRYMETDPLFRSGRHGLMTFSMMYAFNENFILPLSHDECVHGKKTILDKMNGDYWQKFASLKAYLGYMYAHPGKKLLFMGTELGQFMEWRYYEDIEWELLRYETHRGIYSFVRAINRLYRSNPALWAEDTSWEGFVWCNADDAAASVFTFLRKCGTEQLLIAVNMTPVERYDYWVGMPEQSAWELVLSSEDKAFGGSGFEAVESAETDEHETAGHKNRLRLNLPGLSVLIYKRTD